MELEKRTFKFTIEERDDESPVIVGHAAVFNQEADIYGFREQVKPGAFKDSIKKDDVRALFNPDSNYDIFSCINHLLFLVHLTSICKNSGEPYPTFRG